MKSPKISALCLLVIGALMAAPLAHAQVALSDDGVIFPDGTVLTTGTTSYDYEIGDIGPAGGIVFYLEPGSDGLHGLEAAPVDQHEVVLWGCSFAAISGADGQAIGTGKQNSIDIYTVCAERPIAASVAVDYRGPTLDSLGWFLPSKQELNEMYQNKDTIGGFSAIGSYWSSSEYSNNYAWYQYFGTGLQGDGVKSYTIRVRPVRAF